jgi:release factor glutamine methyltransferase
LPAASEAAIVVELRAAGCVFAEDEARLLVSEAQTPAELATMVEQRVSGLPLEQVLGWAEFCGLRIAIQPGVFVPRRRTEFLVSEAIALSRPGIVVLDLCCGSGALGVALASAVNAGAGEGAKVELYAADIERPAVECTRCNLESLGGLVYEGDLFEPLPAALRGRVDILLANVPYVPSGDIRLLPPEARDHEPLVTLDGGNDGLEVLRRVAADASHWLAPGGHLLVETSEHQAASALRAFADGLLDARLAHSDEMDATVIIGTKPAVAP